MTHVDGNALAGMLADVLGVDATTARVECAHCGTVSAIAEAMVTFDGPGPGPSAVVHCPGCTTVLLTVAQRDDEVELNVRGIRSIAFPRDQAR